MATTFRAVLPGTSGNYFSRADVNVLDADTAHNYQSAGWQSWGVRFTNVQQVDSDGATYGGKATQGEVADANNARLITAVFLASHHY